MSTAYYTRQQFMAEYQDKTKEERAAMHRRYFGQFVTSSTIARVLSGIGADRLRASTDPHMNDIPLAMWDRLSPGE